MICADTSVWVAALRDSAGPEAFHLGELMEADEVLMPVSVRIELLSGARQKDLAPLRELFSALPQTAPDGRTWDRIEEWLAVATGRGQRFGVGDLLVASTAADHGAAIWSLDRDFARMAKLGFISLAALPSQS